MPEATIHRESLVAALRAAIAIPSVTGDEAAYADWVEERLRAAGADEVRRLPAAPGRDVVVSRHGPEGPAALLLAGHLDVVRATDFAARWGEDPRADPWGATVVERAIWGRGAADLKGPTCAALAALDGLHAAGRTPARAVWTAWLPDEESGEPGLGRSVGAHALAAALRDGALPRPEAAVYVEPTRLELLVSQIGFLVAEVELTGRAAYFGRPGEGRDALRALHAVLASLWEHDRELRARPAHPLLGEAGLVVHGATAGEGTIAVPGSARLELIRSTLPGEDLEEAAAGVERAVRDALPAGVEAAVAFPAGRDHPRGGLPVDDPGPVAAFDALARATEAVTGGPARRAGATFWAEMSFLDALGIPCCYFAPGDIALAHTPDERIGVDELCDGAACLLRLVEDHCGTRADERPRPPEDAHPVGARGGDRACGGR